jgi:hypothetical protein
MHLRALTIALPEYLPTNRILTPQEYVIYPATQSCLTYGADAFYPWQFGAQQGMRWIRNYTDAGRAITVWGNPSSGMAWEADQACLPVAFSHSLFPAGTAREFTEVTRLQARAVDSIDPAVFQQPAYCHKAGARHRSCRAPLM